MKTSRGDIARLLFNAYTLRRHDWDILAASAGEVFLPGEKYTLRAAYSRLNATIGSMSAARRAG